jgi:hypothetical protein
MFVFYIPNKHLLNLIPLKHLSLLYLKNYIWRFFKNIITSNQGLLTNNLTKSYSFKIIKSVTQGLENSPTKKQWATIHKSTNYFNTIKVFNFLKPKKTLNLVVNALMVILLQSSNTYVNNLNFSYSFLILPNFYNFFYFYNFF